jgi:DNA invertase Pin-like site-specific DNA recombinase
MRRASRFLGGAVPFGYRLTSRGGLEPVPKQQDAIRQMRELRAQGLAYRAIAAQMEANGHKLSHMTVHKILRRAEGMNGSPGP